MEKKIYYSPLIEVENICLSGTLLSSTTGDIPLPGHPGMAPSRRVSGFPAYGTGKVVPVF